MKIAIDARMLAHSGIGTYLRHLLSGLAARPAADTYVVFAPPGLAATVPASPAIEVRPASAPVYGLAEHTRWRRELRRAGCDLVHVPHYNVPLGFDGPLVVTVHDLIHLLYPQFLGGRLRAGAARVLLRNATRCARHILAVSECTRRDLVERLRVDPGKITVVPPGVDAAFRPLPSEEIEAFRARLGLPRRFLLYVGLRRPHKNLERLVRAFDRARQRAGPEVLGSLVLWGAPDPRDAPTDAAVRELGLEREVRRLHQPLADGEMPLLYNACQGFVMPSLYEGFGLPPLEALGCGVPVLSSTGGSLPEVLGDAALYADPLDVEAWAAGLERLVADETLRADLGRRGPVRAAGFAWESTVRATVGVYEAVAGGARERSAAGNPPGTP